MIILNQQMPHPAFLESIFALVFTAILKNEKMRKSSYSTLSKHRIKEKVPICTRGNDKSALIVVFLV
jgi:hypothetical protein